MGRTLLLGILMLAASLASIAFTPKLVGDTSASVNLQDQMPLHFGEWHAEVNTSRLIVSPQVEKTLAALYSETLNRTYINANGDRIMLSLAYGGNQGRRDLQVHKPEVCYVAQGFQISGMTKAEVVLPKQSIPVMHLVAVQGKRTEPITYWIRSGNVLVRGWFEQNKARITAGLNGEINDGLLVRVSSISNEPEKAYDMQEMFIKSMLNAISLQNQPMFLGKTKD